MDAASSGRRRFPFAKSRSAWVFGIAVAAVLFAAWGAEAQRGQGRGAGRDQAAPAAAPGGPIYTSPSPALNISGVWWTQSYGAKIQLIAGGDLPYTDKGKAQYAKNIAALKSGAIRDEARHLCVPDGLPRMLGNPYPFQLLQTSGQVTMMYELNHVIRVILLDKPQVSAHELEVAPYYIGRATR
jgi:hypothetical protein